jgi:hypothetical protein
MSISPSALAMLTEFFADDTEHTARRTGFVKRASKTRGRFFIRHLESGVMPQRRSRNWPRR